MSDATLFCLSRGPSRHRHEEAHQPGDFPVSGVIYPIVDDDDDDERLAQVEHDVASVSLKSQKLEEQKAKTCNTTQRAKPWAHRMTRLKHCRKQIMEMDLHPTQFQRGENNHVAKRKNLQNQDCTDISQNC